MTIHLTLPVVQSEPTTRPAACPLCGQRHLQAAWLGVQTDP
jgi:hypothetical protein